MRPHRARRDRQAHSWHRAWVGWSSATFAALLLGCSTPAPGTMRPPGPGSDLTAKELLPADLDVVLWIDVTRAKQMYLRDAEPALLGILAEYGLLPALSDDNLLGFWLSCLKQTDRLWLACRPRATSCEDPVVLLRGRFAEIDPRSLPHTSLASDLGGGWLRFDRDVPAARSALARVYLAPPDRLLLVSTTELDAVERALERRRNSRSQVPTEAGFVSLQLDPRALAEVVQTRAPAAARWLRGAESIELQLLTVDAKLRLDVTISFETTEGAERAATALRFVLGAFGHPGPAAIQGFVVEAVGQRVIARLPLGTPSTRPPEDGDQGAREGTTPQ